MIRFIGTLPLRQDVHQGSVVLIVGGGAADEDVAARPVFDGVRARVADEKAAPLPPMMVSLPDPPIRMLPWASPVSKSLPAPPRTFCTFTTAPAAPAPMPVADPVARLTVTGLVLEKEE